MIRIPSIFGMAGCALFLPNCVETTGVPYERITRKTESFLRGLPREELFALKRVRLDSGTSFRFNRGPATKGNHIFPTQVKVDILPREQGDNSVLKVSAYERGLFFKRKRRAVASPWMGRLPGNRSNN